MVFFLSFCFLCHCQTPIQELAHCRYVKRRATTGFREHAAVTEEAILDSIFQQAHSDLEVVKRQAIVYHLYSRKQKSVMDIPLETMLKQQAETAPYSAAS